MLIKPNNELQREIPVSATYSSASDIRRKRKISKVKTKVKTQRDEIAEAVIKGDLQKIEDIIDVLDLLHGRGISSVMSYRYSYYPDTDVVRSEETAENENNQNKETLYRSFLNIIHLACVFDQEQVIEFLAMYGHSTLKLRLPISISDHYQISFYSFEKDLVMASHVAARYGSVGSLKSLTKFGFDIFELDINKVHIYSKFKHKVII